MILFGCSVPNPVVPDLPAAVTQGLLSFPCHVALQARGAHDGGTEVW